MNKYSDPFSYEDDKDFHPIADFLFMAIPMVLLLALLISGSVYGFYDYLDRKGNEKAIEAIENIVK